MSVLPHTGRGTTPSVEGEGFSGRHVHCPIPRRSSPSVPLLPPRRLHGSFRLPKADFGRHHRIRPRASDAVEAVVQPAS